MLGRYRKLLQQILGFRNFLFFASIAQARTIRKNPLFADFCFFLDLLPPDAVVLDIGANIGITTAPLAKHCRQGHVYSFEPVPPNFEALSRAVRFHGFRNVTLINKALGETVGEAEMILPTVDGAQRHGLSHIITPERPMEGQKFKATVSTLDIECHQFKRPITAIKMDVEDFERYVLRGGLKFLAQDRPIILTELFDNENRRECFEIVRQLHYSIKILKDGRLIDFDPKTHKALNFFFLPENN